VTSGIYRIDLGNGWFYIGSAANLKRRETEHRTELKFEKHCNKRMQNCWNKYGVFKFTTLEECDKSKLLKREQTYLDQHFNDQKNVNLALIAGNPMLGRKHSAETRAKMSAAAKLRASCSVSDEAKANMSAAQKLRAPHSAETRAKMSAANKGRVRSAEACANMSAATSAAWAVRKAEAA